MSASDWSGGDLASSERLGNMLHKFTDWTPDWSTTTGDFQPSYGNAAIDCRYSRSGDLVVAHFDITFGSTTNFNAGDTGDNWQWSLPIESSSENFHSNGEIILQAGSGSRLLGRARFLSSTVFCVEISNMRVDATAIAGLNQGVVDALSPWTWANGYTLKGVLEYEAV